MTVLVAAAAAALPMAGLLVVSYVAVARVRPFRRLASIEREVTALRREVTGYRATHEHDAGDLARRLTAVEEASARAANEVRMASQQLIARLPAEPVRSNHRDGDGV